MIALPCRTVAVGPADPRFPDGGSWESAVPEPHDERATGHTGPPSGPGPVAARRPRPPARPAELPPRPRVVEDPGILGISRRARGRVGSRVFTWFFVFVYALIVVQMIVAILDPW
jgi:hypothetical protein